MKAWSPRSCAGLLIPRRSLRRVHWSSLTRWYKRRSLKRKENWRKILLGIQTGNKLAKPSFFVGYSRPRGRGGSTPGNSWWGCAARFSKSWPDFRPKKCNSPHSFSDQTSKIHTRFQTWPLGRNYVIITYILAQTKKLFKAISNSHISLSFLLIWNWNDKYVHTLP